MAFKHNIAQYGYLDFTIDTLRTVIDNIIQNVNELYLISATTLRFSVILVLFNFLNAISTSANKHVGKAVCSKSKPGSAFGHMSMRKRVHPRRHSKQLFWFDFELER